MKRIKLIICLVCLILLSGCWDQLMLKDVFLVYSLGVDKTENGEFEATATIPKANPSENTIEQSFIMNGTGKTLREARAKGDNKVPGIIDPSKARVIIVSQDLAEIDLYTVLDHFYRDPRAPLAAKIIISEKSAKEMLNLKIESVPLISMYYNDLIESAEKDTIIPVENLQYICPVMLEKGKDFHLPFTKLLESNGKNEAYIIGTALFNDKQMTGTLIGEESVLANLLMNKKTNDQTATFTIKVSEEEKELKTYNHISVRVTEYQRDIVIEQKGEGFFVDMNLHLSLDVIEYPMDDLENELTINTLNNQIEKELSAIANNVLVKIQEANSDLFGIGRELMAKHGQKFEDVKWKEIYPDLPITVNLDAEIVHHGIIN